MMKYGIEVEGRLKGIMSLFVGVDEIWMIDTALMLYPKTGHINITDHGNQLDLSNDLRLKNLTDSGLLVTVDRTQLHEPVPDHLNVSLYMDASSFQYLKDTDEVKFNNDFNVRTSTKEAMIYTHPDAFAGDKNITDDILQYHIILG